MLYVEEIREYQEELKTVGAGRDISALHGFIMKLRHFIRETKLDHSDFKATQKMLVDLYMENAKIISGSHKLTNREKEKKFVDCYTSMIQDIEEAAQLYERMQR